MQAHRTLPLGIALPDPTPTNDTLPRDVTLLDPAYSGDPNYVWASRVTVSQTCLPLAPVYSTAAALPLVHKVPHGQNDPSGQGQAKTTFIARPLTASWWGCGQRIADSSWVESYGCGDTFARVIHFYIGGGVSGGGDEGQTKESNTIGEVVPDGNPLNRTDIIGVITPATINTTTLAAIAKGAGVPVPQVVRVADVTGVRRGDYITLDPYNLGHPQEAWTECPKVLDVDPVNNTLTLICRHDHPAGARVMPATVLRVRDSRYWGQQRTVVNISRPIYSDGLAAVARGSTTVQGQGTAWTPGVVGGSWENPGAISFDGDTYSGVGSPFQGLQRRVWYLLGAVNDAQTAKLCKRSQVGIDGYTGDVAYVPPNPPVFVPYRIAPAARIFCFDPPQSDHAGDGACCVVLPYNTFQWQPGDLLECAADPSIDYCEEITRESWWTAGIIHRGTKVLVNVGARMLGPALNIMGSPLNLAEAREGIANAANGWMKYGLQLGRLTLGGVVFNAETNTRNSVECAGRGLFWDATAGARRWGLWLTRAFGGFAGQDYDNALGSIVGEEIPATAPEAPWRNFVRFLFKGRLDLLPGTGAFSTMVRFWSGGGVNAQYHEAGCDYATRHFKVRSSNGVTALESDLNGGIALGAGNLPANANNGFAYLPTIAGAPTGSGPIAKAGFDAICTDEVNKRVLVRIGSTWYQAALVPMA